MLVTLIYYLCSAIFLCSPLTFTVVKLSMTIEGKGPFCCITLLVGSQSSSSVYVYNACEASCMKTHCYMNRTNPATFTKGGKACYFKKTHHLNSVLNFFSVATFSQSLKFCPMHISSENIKYYVKTAPCICIKIGA